MEDGAFPVILSGSCFAGVGIVAGLAEPDPAVVWFDAHSDFNTPDTSTEGYFDGMGLAVLTGGAWQAMLARVPGAGPCPRARVVLAGARHFDPPEVRRLEASAVTQLARRSWAGSGARRGRISPAPTGVYLHVDLDVLDIGEPGQRYGAPGGPSGARARRSGGRLCRESPVRALSLTAYDPGFDPEGRVPPIALDLLRVVRESSAATAPEHAERPALWRAARWCGGCVCGQSPEALHRHSRRRLGLEPGRCVLPARGRHRPGTATTPCRRQAS